MLDTDFGEFSFHALGRIRASRRAEALIPSPSSLRAVELLALCSILLRRAEWLAVEAGCQGRRRCGAAWPGPGGAQDEGQEQHLESDGEAVEVEVGPGLPCRVVHRDGDVERCYDEVDGAVDTGGQCRGEQDHEARDGYERQPNGDKGWAGVELVDDAGQDVVDEAGLVQGEVVDVDVQEHEACPRCGELDSHRDPLVFQCGGGLTCSHHLSPSFERWIRLAESNLDIAPPANAPPVPLRSRLPSLRSSFVPPLVVSRFVSADGQSTSLRTRRTPVASSQTSQAANPGSPTNSRGEPSAMARFPAPATISRLPPAMPSRRCHGRVNPVAWVASAAPMKVVPRAGSASANAAAWSCQASSNAGVGSASPPAERTTPMKVTVTRAKIAARVAPAATARCDQSVPAAPRRPTSQWRPVTKMSSSGSSTACRPTAIATASRFCAKASTCSIGAPKVGAPAPANTAFSIATDTANAIAAAPTSRPRTNRLRAFSLVAPSTLIPTPLARRLAVGPGSRRRRRPLLDRRRRVLWARPRGRIGGLQADPSGCPTPQPTPA